MLIKTDRGLWIPGRKGAAPKRIRFRDNMMTFDAAVYDSSGAFLLGELERLDQKLHAPLTSVSWGRDIDLRTDVTLGDDVSSFTNSTFGQTGGLNPKGINWASKQANAVPGPSVTIGKTANPLTLWNTELSWTIPELESARQLGRPVDQQKYTAMQRKHQMDIDQMVYYGDPDMGFVGLCNADTTVVPVNVPAGAGNATQWETKTADEILEDFDFALNTVWENSAWSIMPANILLPPKKLGLIANKKVSDAGNVSILKYVLENNIAKVNAGIDLEIHAAKWLVGLGVGGTQGVSGTVDRMFIYSRDEDLVRYPMTMLQRTPVEPRGIWQLTNYFCKLGVVEFVYPETLGSFDGI